jgi:hypothetical protein
VPRGAAAAVERVLFVAGVAALCFLLGVVAAHRRWPPSGTVVRAGEAAADLARTWRVHLGLESPWDRPAPAGATDGLARRDPEAAAPGHTFVVGYRDGLFHPFLLDARGRVVHRWAVRFSDAFPDPSHLDPPPRDGDMTVHGAALLPGGDVLMNFEASGLVRLDRCGRVLWALPRGTHHGLDLSPDGATVVAVARRRQDRAARPGERLPRQGWFWEDTLLWVDARTGEARDELSLLDAIHASGLHGLTAPDLQAGSAWAAETDDPLHANDVEVLPASLAPRFPGLAAGDLMVSLRNLDAVLFLDGRTRRIKRLLHGPFVRQHDPDFTPAGTVLLLDNREGWDEAGFGQSRLLELDPADGRIVWRFEGGEGGERFYTAIRGKQQLLPNGNVLAVESGSGRVIEVARGSGGNRVVWEWVNLVRPGVAGVLTQADRVPDAAAAAFAGAPCPPAPPRPAG